MHGARQHSHNYLFIFALIYCEQSKDNDIIVLSRNLPVDIATRQRLIQLSLTVGLCEEAVSRLRIKEAGTGDSRNAG